MCTRPCICLKHVTLGIEEQISAVVAVVQPPEFKVSPDYQAVWVLEATSLSYIVSIPDKLSLWIYCVLCENPQSQAYYHEVPSECCDGLAEVMSVFASPNDLRTRLAHQLLYGEGIPCSIALSGLGFVVPSRSGSIMLHESHLRVSIHP